jgi:hypothetical protein
MLSIDASPFGSRRTVSTTRTRVPSRLDDRLLEPNVGGNLHFHYLQFFFQLQRKIAWKDAFHRTAKTSLNDGTNTITSVLRSWIDQNLIDTTMCSLPKRTVHPI